MRWAGVAWLALAPLLAACAGDRQRPLPAGTTVTIRGHHELAPKPRGGADAALLPLYLLRAERGTGDTASPPGLCLNLPPGTDTSQWEAALELRGPPAAPPGEPSPPVARSGTVVCFEASWPRHSGWEGEAELCGRAVDRWDGSRFDIPCRRIFFSPKAELRAALMTAVGTAVGRRHDAPAGAFLDSMSELSRQARAAGLLWLSAQIHLITAHYLIEEGEPVDLESAHRLLAALPAWVEDAEAHGLAADAAYLAGRLELAETFDLEAAWGRFREAERRYARVIDRKRLAATRGLAEILARVGAIREASQRLADGLANCAEEPTTAPPPSHRGPCSSSQRQAARGLAGWLTLLDPDASATELEAAEQRLAEIAASPSLEVQERANHLVNLALLRSRQGESPVEALQEARRQLAPYRESSRKAGLLLAWSRLVEASYELTMGGGDLDRALSLCEEVATLDLTPRLTAWALSCSGRIHHRLGNLEHAAWAFDRALVYHEHATPERLGQLLPLGPGQRANDFYRAARLALEQGEGRRAWDLLAGLDRLAASEEACRQCRDHGVELPDHHPERQRLLRRLASLDTPARGRDAREILRPILERLRELAAPCSRCAAPPLPDSAPGYRAFALDDEIFLLSRDRAGRVGLARRTPLPRGGVRKVTDTIAAALERRDVSDEQWRALAVPLARALVPPRVVSLRPSPLPPVTPYRLHGLLQSVPLGALPVPGDGPPRWLGELTVVVVRPAGLRAPPPPREGSAPPLFVVDPARNLHRSDDLLALYRRLFPAGRWLAGKEATQKAFRRAVARASWLHADVHGVYDPAFPEHSSLGLADGPITLVELADLPMDLGFANLSGCRTGSWPTTADSGRYGIGGLIARRGARWVIASRSDLLDPLTLDFNPAFYRAIQEGKPVPVAYGQAMARVRRRHAAVAWGALFLLAGGADPEVGG